MEHLNGQINTEIILMKETYEIAVEMPTGKPMYDDTDYTLTIFSKKVQEETNKGEKVKMLAHIVASYDADKTSTMPDNFYLQLSPPADILPTVKNDKDEIIFAINSLSIKFSTGKYTTIPGVIPGSEEGTKPVAVV